MPERSLDIQQSDTDELNSHLQACCAGCGLFRRFCCVAESIDAFLAPRFVTTLAAVVTVILVVSVLLA